MGGAGDGEEGAEPAQAQLRAAGFLRHGCFLSCFPAAVSIDPCGCLHLCVVWCKLLRVVDKGGCAST
jgi:hypothetical protein